MLNIRKGTFLQYIVNIQDGRCGEFGRYVNLIMINDAHFACILSKYLFEYAPGADESTQIGFALSVS